MSQLTKQQLKGENQTQFPNNNVGAITPSNLRAFNVDMIDSTVNQTDFTNFSGSVAGQFASATGSVTSAITASSLITASFDNGTRNLTFTKGDASTFAVNIPDVSGSTLNTGSFLITASISNDDITFTKGDGSQFTIQVATGSFALSSSYAETASLAINAKDIIVNVKNTTGAQINKGTVVRIIGATGDNALIGTASWEDDNNSANTLGFVTANIPNDNFGTVMTQGTLLGINTDPTLGYAAGQILYLSSSGQYTNQKPPAPYHEVRLGQVLRVQQNNGSIYVLIQNGYELEELHDVDINTGSLANNNLLAYNSASRQWENKTLTQVGAATTASFNAYTASNNQRVSSLEANSASVNISINSINQKTGSFATTGSNIFAGNQIITGSLIISSSATYDLEITGAARVTSQNGLQTNTIGANTFNIETTRDASVPAENFIFASTASAAAVYVGVYDSPNFNTDVELKLKADSTGLSFNDWDNGSVFDYVPFMTVAANVGDNPLPTFTRGLQLAQLNPLPAGADGQLAVSASNLYFFSGSAWRRIAFA